MKSIHRGVAFLAGFVLAMSLVPVSPAQAKGDAERAEHERIVKFWTKDKVAKAKGRDFVLDPKTGKAQPAAKPSKPGGSTVLGASWNGQGAVKKTTGKVLFSMGSSYYVCSASVVEENKQGRSIILTAAHCAYDEENTAFAENWMFIPDYDSSAVDLTKDGSFCAQTMYGCWTAAALVVHDGYASAGGFNLQAIKHDFAFAVVYGGGLDGTTSLDAAVGGGQAIAFTKGTSGADTYLFGYPAAGKYHGADLVYSRGALGFDPLTAKQTYRVSSDLTGGSSGGPWFRTFDASVGTGTLMSVNSYGYNGITAMHGPFFNGDTSALYHEAETATVNTVVG